MKIPYHYSPLPDSPGCRICSQAEGTGDAILDGRPLVDITGPNHLAPLKHRVHLLCMSRWIEQLYCVEDVQGALLPRGSIETRLVTCPVPDCSMRITHLNGKPIRPSLHCFDWESGDFKHPLILAAFDGNAKKVQECLRPQPSGTNALSRAVSKAFSAPPLNETTLIQAVLAAINQGHPGVVEILVSNWVFEKNTHEHFASQAFELKRTVCLEVLLEAAKKT